MEVSMEQAYAEACRALGESMVRERLLTQALAAANAKGNGLPLALEADGHKVYGPHSDGTYSVSRGGQWLSGAYGKSPEEALIKARASVSPQGA